MIVRNMMTKKTCVVEYDLDSPRERGWPSDCRKCSLYDQEKWRIVALWEPQYHAPRQEERSED